MAKSPRIQIPPLPFSDGFYERTRAVAKRFGLAVQDPARLAQAVAALSRTYTRERAGLAEAALAEDAASARLGFFLPRDAIKTFGPLRELASAGRFQGKSELRVLDLGAGLGSTSIGAARFMRFANTGVQRLVVSAVERDGSAGKLMRALCQELRALPEEFASIELELRTDDLTRVQARGPFDLIFMGLSLNELYLEQGDAERIEQRAQLLAALARTLSPEGALIVLEPALKESARELMRVRDALVKSAAELHVFAPCVHRNGCPMLQGERDWCHEALDYALPTHLIDVARSAGLRYEGLSYAALVLTRTPRLKESETRYRIVSDRLVSKGKLELYGCGTQGYQRLTRLDRDASEANRSFDELRRGDLVRLAEARVGKTTRVDKE